jgi:hypothetical protein
MNILTPMNKSLFPLVFGSLGEIPTINILTPMNEFLFPLVSGSIGEQNNFTSSKPR